MQSRRPLGLKAHDPSSTSRLRSIAGMVAAARPSLYLASPRARRARMSMPGRMKGLTEHLPPMSSETPKPRIAIIGGGCTGAATAVHLLRRLGPSTAADITIYEPRETLGTGLAYSTSEPVHRINVPAEKMSLYPDEPTSFVSWLERTDALADDPQAFAPDGQPYPRRAAFGAYVASEIGPYLSAGAVHHVRAAVTRIEQNGALWRIVTEQNGSNADAAEADLVVLAVSHPPPAAPRTLQGVAHHPGLIADATLPDALDGVKPDDRILIVGNGLTAADVIAALERRGHKGPLVSISRRGLRSRGHADKPQEPFGDFITHPAQRASELLHRVRDTIRQANAQGISWHAVLDALRIQGQELWRALPLAEKRRLVRLARPYWDVHRFRIAPQVEAVLDKAVAEGRLRILAASLKDAQADGDTITVTLRHRGTHALETLDFERVIVTTGPAHGGILESQPCLKSLSDAGLIGLCATGLGIACDASARAIASDGASIPGLLIAGPLARGTFGELMGLPQVTEHAVFIAQEIGRCLETPS